MRVRTLIILILFILLVSCNNKKNPEDEPIAIEKPYPHIINIKEGFDNPSQIKLSSIADSIKYIVLSKEKDVIINAFPWLQMNDSDIYINFRGLIYRFALSGKFLNAIGKMGRGPEEYMLGSQFAISSSSKNIYVKRNYLDDYISYKTSGEFIGKISLKKSDNVWEFRCLSDSVFMYTFYYGFINKIDRYGRGPGEYTYVVDMHISPGADTITLFDKSLKKLLSYNTKGEFLGDVDLKTDLETFTVLPNGDILGYSFLNHAEPLNDTIYQLWHFNRYGKIISGFLPVKKDYLGNSIGLSSPFNSTSSGLYFLPYTENRVYKISGNPPSLTSVYEIDFKNKTIPSELLAMPYKEMQKAFFSSYILYGEFIGRINLLFSIYSSDERKFLLAAYNLKTGSYMLTESKNVWDDINELPVIRAALDDFSVSLCVFSGFSLCTLKNWRKAQRTSLI